MVLEVYIGNMQIMLSFVMLSIYFVATDV
jgi:hypothetical protein